MTQEELNYLLTLDQSIGFLHSVKPKLNTSNPKAQEFGRATVVCLRKLLDMPGFIEDNPDIGKVIHDTYKALNDGLNQYKKRREIELASISISKPEDFHG